MRAAVTGATGLVGSAVCAALEADGYTVHRITRSPTRATDIGWNPAEQQLNAEAIDGMDVIVHLAGESVSGARWSSAKKSRILESRVQGTTLIAQAIARLAKKPSVLISASATGFYGDGGQQSLTEHSPNGHNFLANVCAAWENATQPAEQAGVRTVHLRIGLVLAANGGALKPMLPVFRAGLGGPLGSGKQWMSWIAIDDLVGAIQHCITNNDLSGAVLGVSPNPVQQRAFAKVLGRVLRRPARIPTPGFAIRAAMGEMGQQLLLEGQRCKPSVLQNSGFQWAYPELEAALRALV